MSEVDRVCENWGNDDNPLHLDFVAGYRLQQKDTRNDMIA